MALTIDDFLRRRLLTKLALDVISLVQMRRRNEEVIKFASEEQKQDAQEVGLENLR